MDIHCENELFCFVEPNIRTNDKVLSREPTVKEEAAISTCEGSGFPI
jgi:hypothetical protein